MTKFPQLMGVYLSLAFLAIIGTMQACTTPQAGGSVQQLAAVQATVAAVCSTETVYEDAKAAAVAAKRCAAEQALLAVLQATAASAPAH